MTSPHARVFFLRHPSTQMPIPWRWPNFRYDELECRDGTGLLLDTAALDLLQRLRSAIRRPIYVTSAYRSVAHNANVGGAQTSFHLSGRAFDITAPGYSPRGLAFQAQAIGFTGIGLYANFTHVDNGPVRTWTG